jgi:RNA polymerase sigma-70 factor (ECF subfamily)
LEVAKDLTQETWLKAFRGINTFRGDAAFSSWIYRIAENVCIDFFRKQKVANSIEPLHTVDEHRITDTHPDPSERLQTQELRQILHKALEYLTQSRKEVFLLYYVQDLSIKTIAKRLKRSEGTVKTHLRNARLQLQEHLNPYLRNEDIPWLA